MFAFLHHYYPVFVQGTAQTILISFIGILIGIGLGLCFVSLRRSKYRLFQYVARLYIAIVRGTPSMIQVMLIYYGLSKMIDIPQIQFLGSGLDRLIPGSIALGINSGAYTAEIFRSGLISIPRGQTEAGLTLGLSNRTTLYGIVMPQAVRNVLPALGNEFITLIKESSVLFYIGVQEVTAQALGVGGTLYNFIPPLLVAAVIYFVLTQLMSLLVSLMEKRLGNAYLKVPE